MQALVLTKCDGSSIEHQFNVGITVASLLAAMIIGAICMSVAMPTHAMSLAKSTNNETGRPTASSLYWELPIKVQGHTLYIGKFEPKRFAAATGSLAAGVCVMHWMVRCKHTRRAA
jgi:uncharacterized membrane protein YjjB (DUF3815 family)